MPAAEHSVGRGALDALTSHSLEAHGHRDDPAVARLLAEIHRRHGDKVAAVLLYGSYLRGKRDTLIDLYVLLTDFDGALPGRWQALGNRSLPPNVYYLSLQTDPPAAPTAGADDAGAAEPQRQQSQAAVRAKYATLSLAQFASGMNDFHCYFWARFVQPTGLVFVRDEVTRGRVVAAMVNALDTFAHRVTPTLGERFSSADLWRCGFALTYACELRSEHPDGIAALYDHNASHFDQLLAAYAQADGALAAAGGGGYRAASAAAGSRGARLSWAVRRSQGKLLSVLRLVKAAGTFEDPLDYLLWKLERHSGVYIAPTERQRRRPLIFAWGLLWRLYRRGAFR
ncbi:MAG: hypothetical protein ACNA7W_00050 [Pseudomonadales bacterium]